MLKAILDIFIPNNVTKFACAQNIKVTCSFAWKIIGRGCCLSFINKLQAMKIYICLYGLAMIQS